MSPICRTFFSFSRFPIHKKRFTIDLSLYLVANKPTYPDDNQFFAKVMSSVRGGVSCVQLRDHKNDLLSTIKTAIQLKTMLNGVPLIINTLRPIEVMQAVNAEGIYLEENFIYSEVRKILGQKIHIGVPVKTIGEVLAFGLTHEIDYLSVKVSRSKKTCPRNDQLWGMEGLRNVRSISPHRIVAIGGLNLSYAESIYQELRPDDGIAMASGIMDEQNPYLTARAIQSKRRKLRGCYDV